MKLRVDSLALVGTSREVAFQPGLNVILGPISTGKSSLMRLLDVFLGANYRGITPEVDRSVSEIAGELTIASDTYSIIRPLVQSSTTRVQVAGEETAERLPAMRPEPHAPLTYGVWLLNRLGLPVLRVPQAPTRPEDSPDIPVSIGDYLRYCRLRQDEIDVDVLGSSNPFRDIKRRYAFRILYGAYDAELARLQEELRALQSELTQLQGGQAAFEHFLTGTALENRAAIQRELAQAREQQERLTADRLELAAPSQMTPRAQQLRARISADDERLGASETELDRERRSRDQLRELANELQAQSMRLTKAIVAGERFFDFEFVVCPRCGTSVSSERSEEGLCYVCLQPEPPAPTREDLIREQERVNAQIAETEELTRAHEARAADLEQSVGELRGQRAELGRELDEERASFVSDQAERLETLAREHAAIAERIHRLEDYVGLFDRLDATMRRISELEQRKADIEAELDRAEQLDSVTAGRIERLEEWFAHYVEALEIPRFGTATRAAIDRNDFQPIVNGQKFPQLSAGVRVLVNIAHLLAHHRVALELELPLPGLLMIDGIAKNIGTAGYDAARIYDVWNELLRMSEELGDEVQLIVAANDVPEAISPYVRLELSESHRLIPAQDLG